MNDETKKWENVDEELKDRIRTYLIRKQDTVKALGEVARINIKLQRKDYADSYGYEVLEGERLKADDVHHLANQLEWNALCDLAKVVDLHGLYHPHKYDRHGNLL